MNKLRGRHLNTLTVGNDQMLFALPVEVDGVEETLFTTKEMQSNTSSLSERSGLSVPAVVIQWWYE